MHPGFLAENMHQAGETPAAITGLTIAQPSSRQADAFGVDCLRQATRGVRTGPVAP